MLRSRSQPKKKRSDQAVAGKERWRVPSPFAGLGQILPRQRPRAVRKLLIRGSAEGRLLMASLQLHLQPVDSRKRATGERKKVKQEPARLGRRKLPGSVSGCCAPGGEAAFFQRQLTFALG
jgi:hypothetical protein